MQSRPGDFRCTLLHLCRPWVVQSWHRPPSPWPVGARAEGSLELWGHWGWGWAWGLRKGPGPALQRPESWPHSLVLQAVVGGMCECWSCPREKSDWSWGRFPSVLTNSLGFETQPPRSGARGSGSWRPCPSLRKMLKVLPPKRRLSGSWGSGYNTNEVEISRMLCGHKPPAEAGCTGCIAPTLEGTGAGSGEWHGEPAAPWAWPGRRSPRCSPRWCPGL